MVFTLHEVERVDIVRALAIGAMIDLVTLFGIWPAFGEPYPTFGQYVLTVALGQAMGAAIMIAAKVKRR